MTSSGAADRCISSIGEMTTLAICFACREINVINNPWLGMVYGTYKLVVLWGMVNMAWWIFHPGTGTRVSNALKWEQHLTISGSFHYLHGTRSLQMLVCLCNPLGCRVVVSQYDIACITSECDWPHPQRLSAWTHETTCLRQALLLSKLSKETHGGFY